MTEEFHQWPEAVANTMAIAKQCHLDIDLKTLHFPQFPVPEGHTEETFFEAMVRAGLADRYPKLTEEVKARADMEIDVIKKMHFASYFLIVWDFVKYARENGIPVGPGRGSAAGSIVSYALRITDIDPLRYGLLFERFLNPERRSMPDIDMDFADDRREEVLAYIRRKYGEKNVAQIVTYGTMGARTAVKDVARAFGVPAADGERLAKILPEQMSFAEALKESPGLRRELEATPERRQIFSIARKLENTLRQYGKHAAGTLIADRDVKDYVPLCLDKDDNILSQYDKDRVEKVGLIKMDLLGLITLSVIRDALREIRKTEGKEIDVDNLPLDDKKTFHLLQRGRTVGVFQMEAAGFTKTLLNLKPTNMDDLAALLALYRPGPLMSGVVDSYIRRKHGLENVEYPDPKLKDILEETYGVIVYQEQVMQIARVMSGFSLAQADHIRKAMGKKDENIMNQQMQKLLDGAKTTGFNLTVAAKMCEQIKEFSKYAFNKSHSVAYAHVAWQTAWIKAHFPAEFMASLLTHEMDKQDKLVKNINECRSLKIRVLRPDINLSFEYFTVSRDETGAKAVCFCLAAVKGVGQKAVAAIVEEREKRGPFKDFLDFCRRVDLRLANKRVLEALVKVGAFDSLEPNRARIVENLDGIQTYVNLLKGQEASGQIQLFSQPVEFKFREVADWDEVQRLEQEKELLGYYVSSHPLAKYSEVLERAKLDRTSSLAEMPEESRVRLAGLVTKIRQEIVKEKYLKIYFDLEDYDGAATAELWEDTARKYRDDLRDKMLVQVEGKLKFFANQVKISVDRLIPMESLSETSVSEIHVKVGVVGLEEDTLSGLKQELLENKGNAAVYLHFFEPFHGERRGEKETRVLRIYDQIRCRPTRRLKTYLADHFGEDSYWFDLKR
jgi:DNA polymerase-3 subunit alpha